MHDVHSKELRSSGVTLVELLMAIVVLAPIFLMTMLTFVGSARMNDFARNKSAALSALLERMAQIEQTPFNQIHATHHNTTFTADGLNGIGSTRVDNSQASYRVITITFCWMESDSRVIGEDANLNGQLDQGEDQNGNGELDSPVKLVTVVYNV